MQQDNNHTRRFTEERLKKNKGNVLEWQSQSPDLNPTEMLWKKLKQTVHWRKPANITELMWYCFKKWAKIPTNRCAGLISSYKKHLAAVIGSHQILKAKIHILLPLTNIYVCSNVLLLISAFCKDFHDT